MVRGPSLDLFNFLCVQLSPLPYCTLDTLITWVSGTENSVFSVKGIYQAPFCLYIYLEIL